MSTFTEWNGPPPARGPSTKDVLALIDAYNNANATLVQHLAGTAADDVHRFNTAEGILAQVESGRLVRFCGKHGGVRRYAALP